MVCFTAFIIVLFVSFLYGKCIKKPPIEPIETFSQQSSEPYFENGYCTYHNYYPEHSMMTPACSDGEYGINTRWGYDTLSPMYPYVTAFSNVNWNHPNCGACVRVTSSTTTIYLTIIDQVVSERSTHFDIAPEAFKELFGDQGMNDGHGYVDWEMTSSSNCKGNLG
jgi:hypothetical protein